VAATDLISISPCRAAHSAATTFLLYAWDAWQTAHFARKTLISISALGIDAQRLEIGVLPRLCYPLYVNDGTAGEEWHTHLGVNEEDAAFYYIWQHGVEGRQL